MSHSVNMFVLEFMELLRLLQGAGEIQQAITRLHYEDGTQQTGNVDLYLNSHLGMFIHKNNTTDQHSSIRASVFV